MELERRKSALISLGKALQSIETRQLDELCLLAANQNTWFTATNVKHALAAWASSLTAESVNTWLDGCSLTPDSPKNVGLILAGNIPLVGLHDVLSVLVSGHNACIKYSSQDTALMKFVLKTLFDIEPAFGKQVKEVEQLKGIDAAIATGSDNSARYFKQYFAKFPHIIRQNRTSVGILNGDETIEDFKDLGNDIFQYYGLGCQNVSKLYVPKDYNFVPFIEAQAEFEQAIEHHKFRNNFDYNKSIYLVNKEPHLDSGFFLMRESTALVSPISVLFYEKYESEAQLALKLSAHKEKIQCVVSKNAWLEGSLAFGTAQQPALWDYADGVDTLEFLTSL